MDYNFRIIEKRWQDAWREQRIYHATENAEKPKFYVLDMFPYPSGAGLHVGHPLGYIASDIFARYKRQKGFNVLHPMGYDAFGLPAEQYAIQTGQHPAVTTQQNIARYRQQLDKLGFSFDWEREVRTADPKYYKWTQWVFIKLFNHYYDYNLDKAQPIDQLVAYFEKNGSKGLNVAETRALIFTADEWNAMNEHDQQEILLNYRLAYIADTWVNWCPQLGTVLANDEVVNGVSERGGYPVERKLMKQWMLRVSAYSERLLKGLENLEWSDSIKEIQRNWIGRSEGAFIRFEIENSEKTLDIFTTRPDTIFGVSFMVMCPEHSLIEQITTPECRKDVESYVTWARNRAETERQTDVKKVSGVFTGAYCINPFTKERIPIWVAEYVLAGYGTGGIMAVPAHDSRDYAFAKHFNLPIREVIEGGDISQCAFETKEGTVINSDFISGMKVKEAGKCIIEKVKEMGIGYGTVNYRLRDAIFSRQRYWGEPFPVYYKNGIPYVVSEDQLPVLLPQIDEYKPTAAGEPPLARAVNWKTPEGYTREYNTMPGFAGSSGYYIRYMDPHNDDAFVAPEKVHYWQNVDLYVGGSEHATGHLIYSRFWNKFLFDLGYVCQDEPYRKLINQGMIQGRTNFVYRINGTNTFVSLNLKNDYDVDPIRVDVNIVHNDILDRDAFKQWRPEYANAEFILEGDKYVCGWEIEKMSKSKYNVQNPDDLVDKYGADTLRLYEMFLGPIEVSKPWDTNGIEGVFRFMKKLWKLYHDANNVFCVIDDEPTREEYKALHKVIKKVEEDNEKFSFNTAVSAFMIAVNELTELKCHKRKILEPLAVLIAAYAPHIAEELWHLLGHSDFVVNAPFPLFDAQYLVENTVNYPVSFNGKVRLQRVFPIDMSPQEIESIIMQDMDVQKYLDGKSPKKVIIVPKRIINIVI